MNSEKLYAVRRPFLLHEELKTFIYVHDNFRKIRRKLALKLCGNFFIAKHHENFTRFDGKSFTFSCECFKLCCIRLVMCRLLLLDTLVLRNKFERYFKFWLALMDVLGRNFTMDSLFLWIITRIHTEWCIFWTIPSDTMPWIRLEGAMVVHPKKNWSKFKDFF